MDAKPIPDIRAWPASFRDPSGEIFTASGEFFRRLRPGAQDSYERFMASGLYETLVSDHSLVPHQEMDASAEPDTYKILRPEQIPFISYPYEWCFSALRDAARLTLRIQQRALDKGFSLKDASAYNVQFYNGRPIFIDTLSFEPYVKDQPWIGYGQFWRHFAAPLLMMAYKDARLHQLLRAHLDGIPLDLARALLPTSLWLRKPLLWLQLRLQAPTVQSPGASSRSYHVTLDGQRRLLDQLLAFVEELPVPKTSSAWVDYYAKGESYTSAAWQTKLDTIRQWLEIAAPKRVWDLGSNTGTFSHIAAESGAQVVAIDYDIATVESFYQRLRQEDEARILPLCMDLPNASPGLGWAHEERLSLTDRGPADMILALALVHHLTITAQVPFSKVAEWFSSIGRQAIVEFVPVDDPQTHRLLGPRSAPPHAYSVEHFEHSFLTYFRLRGRQALPQSGRILYHLERLS